MLSHVKYSWDFALEDGKQLVSWIRLGPEEEGSLLSGFSRCAVVTDISKRLMHALRQKVP